MVQVLQPDVCMRVALVQNDLLTTELFPRGHNQARHKIRNIYSDGHLSSEASLTIATETFRKSDQGVGRFDGRTTLSFPNNRLLTSAASSEDKRMSAKLMMNVLGLAGTFRAITQTGPPAKRLLSSLKTK